MLRNSQLESDVCRFLYSVSDPQLFSSANLRSLLEDKKWLFDHETRQFQKFYPCPFMRSSSGLSPLDKLFQGE